MHLNIDKNEFLKILQRIQGIVEKRNTMPILANVCLTAEGNSLNISATDLEIFIKDSTTATVTEEGTVTVNAKRLFEIIKQLPEADVELKVEKEEKIKIKSGKVKFNIVGLPATEFPAFPVIEEEKLVKIDPELFKDMIDKTIIAVSTDETRYNINGFMLMKKDNKTRIVTTDGHRLAIIFKAIENMPGEEEGVILPKKGVIEMKKLLEEKEGAYYLGINDKGATMKKGATIINTRLIEGEFPDFNQVMPKENDKKLEIDKEQLLNSLKRVSILSTEKVKGVKFGITTGKLTLSSSSPDIGDVTEEVEVNYEGEDLEIAFNAKYFIDALEVIEEEKVQIELKDQLSPGVLSPVNTEGYTYIVMPMRL